MELQFKQVITCSTSFTSNVQEVPEISSSLERICDTYEQAEALLESLYTDASNKEETRFGTYYCDPIWLSADKSDLGNIPNSKSPRKVPMEWFGFPFMK